MYCTVASSRVGYATPPQALSVHSTTCSIKFTVPDWFTALHNCFWSINLLVVWFFCRAWLFYSYQKYLSFPNRVYNVFPKYLYAKKVARILRRFKESKLSIGKFASQENVPKSCLQRWVTWGSDFFLLLVFDWSIDITFLSRNGIPHISESPHVPRCSPLSNLKLQNGFWKKRMTAF